MKITDNKTILIENYNKIDGRNAYNSNISNITIGKPVLEENKVMEIAIQMWEDDGTLKAELAIHQVFDLMIFFGKTLSYFKEAYRIPNLYNKDEPIFNRIALQGDFVDMKICLENEDIDSDIQDFMNSIAHMGDMNHERLTMITKILDTLEYLY